MRKNARQLVDELSAEEIKKLLIAAIEEISYLTDDNHEEVVENLQEAPY